MGVLTYLDKQFYFKDGSLEETKNLFSYSKQYGDNWIKINPDDYATTDFQAAARFKHLADPKTKKIFDKLFIKFYEMPKVPSLLERLSLDPHQREGIKWILTRSRSYIAHAPGAGKTAQAILSAVLTLKNKDQALFIVPPTLIKNWEKEIAMWTDEFYAWPSIGIVHTSARQEQVIWDARFLICPDSMLTRDWVLEKLTTMSFKFLAVDEASRFKDGLAARSIALYGGRHKNFTSPGLIYKPKHTVFLDGSPMPNRAMELYAPAMALAPETFDFMSQSDFGFKYCGATLNEHGQWEFKHTTNMNDLRSRLTKNFMHIVTEGEINHPERRRSIVYTNTIPTSMSLTTWENVIHKKKAWIDNVGEGVSTGELAAFRRELGLSKVTWIIRYIRERLEKNESILLFVWHVDVAQIICQELEAYAPVGLVIGSTPSAARELFFEAFQAGKLKLLIGNIRAMGVGHNLQRADRVVFGEYSWTDEYNKQCEKRASRKGSDKSWIPCEYVVAPGTLDERILKSVFRKEQAVKRVIG